LRSGDELAITATGPGAETTTAELAALVTAGLGEASDAGAASATAIASATSPASAGLPPFTPGTEVLLEGIAAAAGLAIGRAVRLPALDDASALDAPRGGAGADLERARLADALAAVRGDLEQTIAGARARGDAQAADIFGAHLALLGDPELAAA